MRSVQITDEVYIKLLELAIANGHKDLSEIISQLVREDEEPENSDAESGIDLYTQGGQIPHGTKLRASYKGRGVEAVVRDGRIWIDNRSFKSPSAAAIAFARSMGNSRPSINGWIFWEYQDVKSGKWKSIRDFQKE